MPDLLLARHRHAPMGGAARAAWTLTPWRVLTRHANGNEQQPATTNNNNNNNELPGKLLQFYEATRCDS